MERHIGAPAQQSHVISGQARSVPLNRPIWEPFKPGRGEGALLPHARVCRADRATTKRPARHPRSACAHTDPDPHTPTRARNEALPADAGGRPARVAPLAVNALATAPPAPPTKPPCSRHPHPHLLLVAPPPPSPSQQWPPRRSLPRLLLALPGLPGLSAPLNSTCLRIVPDPKCSMECLSWLLR